jgi:hypothetical protein
MTAIEVGCFPIIVTNILNLYVRLLKVFESVMVGWLSAQQPCHHLSIANQADTIRVACCYNKPSFPPSNDSEPAFVSSDDPAAGLGLEEGRIILHPLVRYLPIDEYDKEELFRSSDCVDPDAT